MNYVAKNQSQIKTTTEPWDDSLPKLNRNTYTLHNPKRATMSHIIQLSSLDTTTKSSKAVLRRYETLLSFASRNHLYIWR